VVDQNTKSVTNLFMVLAVLAMAALAYSVSQRSASDSEQPLLVPALSDQLNDIQSVSITLADNATIATLSKSAENDNEWVAGSAADFPVNVGKLRRILMLLADAKLIEEKTSSPEYYDRLGVKGMDDSAASGLQIDIVGLAEPISIIVGDSGINGDYTYVRRSNEATAWLVSGRIEPGRQAHDWLDRVFVNLTSDRVQMVTIAHPDGENLVIGKASVEDSAYTLEDLSADEMLSFEGVLTAIVGVPTNLELDDVIAADDFDAADQAPVITTFMTFDGLLLEFSTYNSNEQNIVKLNATATKSEADAEAASINAATARWVFKVPSYKASQLTKRKSDLLKTEES
jgi:hypothetical protein